RVPGDRHRELGGQCYRRFVRVGVCARIHPFPDECGHAAAAQQETLSLASSGFPRIGYNRPRAEPNREYVFVKKTNFIGVLAAPLLMFALTLPGYADSTATTTCQDG